LNNFLLKFVNDYYSDQISEIAKEIQHYNSQKIGIMKTNVNLDKKIFKITNDISVLNATIEEKSAEAIKNQENLSKMNNDKIKFENQKSSSLIQIQIIENNIKTLNLKIDDFKTKQANLL
jgi:chromosome segregation ATPase